MPHNRPPISSHALYRQFERLKRVDAGGAFNGGIYVVRDHKTGRRCIEKAIQPSEIVNGKAAKEIKIMRALSHQCIVRYIDAFIDNHHHKPQSSLYMENCQYGSLDDLFKKYINRRTLPCEHFVWEVFVMLVNAVGYLQHGLWCTFRPVGARPGSTVPGWAKFVHRDLHPGNIFLKASPAPQESGFPMICVGDFGQSTVVEHELMYNDGYRYQNPAWMPVEAPGYGLPSDIWSIGAVIQETCHLDGLAPHDTGFRGIPARYSCELNEAIAQILLNDWRRRPDIRRIAMTLSRLMDRAKFPLEPLPAWLGIGG